MKIATWLAGVIMAASVMMAPQGVAKGPTLSDAQVKQAIIEESIAEYPGTCACPFNRARNGSSCGRRSAWSKAGGYAPICYANEVTKEMINAWRERQQ